jgi:hypothetical protein
MTKTQWQVTDTRNARYLGMIEFQDNKGEWQLFETMATKTRVVFGSACNVGFIESGYIEREDGETLDETLSEMMDDLRVYYDDGPQYVSRIVCNDRM